MHTSPSAKDIRSSGEYSATDGPQLLDGEEAKAARAWFAHICRTDLGARIREFTRTDGVDVWTVSWGNPLVLKIGDAGESLSSLLIHAHRSAIGRAD